MVFCYHRVAILKLLNYIYKLSHIEQVTLKISFSRNMDTDGNKKRLLFCAVTTHQSAVLSVEYNDNDNDVFDFVLITNTVCSDLISCNNVEVGL